MKKKNLHIRFAWIILICFLAGQAMVYSHQHHAISQSVSRLIKGQAQTPTLSEKCNLCDIMHHTHMAIFGNAALSPVVTICDTHYNRHHDYVGIALILSAGRSPPAI